MSTAASSESQPDAAPTQVLPKPDPNATTEHFTTQTGAGVPLAERCRIPGYELFGEIGRGGMGVVYKAQQYGFNRIVALKMILAGGHAGAEDLARFRTEAEAIARLQHPNVVQVYDIGEHEGRPFFSLEYCGGGSLSEKLQGRPQPPLEAAQLVQTLARAMHVAHQRKIVHRDLKPANVLLDANGTPKITDFGLAKRLDEVGKTQSGAIMGTPSYMAPEQANGRIWEIGPPADIYSLGAILYEMLTGRPPFEAPTSLEIILQVVANEPTPPSVRNPATPRNLEAICLKCLKDPERRYASAGDLADDLQRFVAGEEVRAPGSNVLDQLARSLDRCDNDAEFQSWARLLFFFAGVLLVEVVLLLLIDLALLLNWWEPSSAYYWIIGIRDGKFVVMMLAFWLWRRRLAPASGPERRMWSLWIAFFLAIGLSVIVPRLYAPAGQPPDPHSFYPTWATLSGVVFFVLGGSFWGRCYLFGLAFFALAVVLPLEISVAALPFGLLWSTALIALGLHLRRLDRQKK